MVGHFGLKIRMMVAGSIIFGFYAAVAGIVYLWLGATTGALLITGLGLLLVIGVMYKLGRYMAIRSVGAEDMPEDARYRDIHRQADQLCRDMNIEKPRLMVARMGVPNAFAVGRKGDGIVVISEEIIDLLDSDELEGVLAHELAHIKNRDVVVMVLGQAIAMIVGYLVQFAIIFGGEDNIGSLFLGIIAGSLAQMLVSIFVLAISRYREYVADSDAAEYTNNPDAMARALEKISSGAQQRRQTRQASRRGRGRGRGRGRQQDQGTPDEVAALCIFGGERGFLRKIFSTHPPVEKRIEKLRSMTTGY